MTLEELEENEDEFGEEDEAAIEMYRWVEIMQCGVWCTGPLPVTCISTCQSPSTFFSIQSWPDLLQFSSTEVVQIWPLLVAFWFIFKPCNIFIMFCNIGNESINLWWTLTVECDVCDTSLAETHSFCLHTDVRCGSSQAEASCGVEGSSDKECVWRGWGNLRAGLHHGGQQGWGRHLGGAAPLQTGVGHPTKQFLFFWCCCLIWLNWPFKPFRRQLC